ncbi:MAG TPA: hypothetical protein VIV60_01510, partial [Polyangiaceae bacterium]
MSHRIPIGRRLAQLFCVFFGAIGALPLLLGLVLRTERVRLWAEQQTARILLEQAGISAHFKARVNLWPLELRVEDLTIPATDGGSPALRLETLRAAPRLFALLSGKLDIGQVWIERPELRLVIVEGHIANLKLRSSQRRGSSGSLPKTAPFSNISMSDARVDLTLDGRRIQPGPIDLDVTAEHGLEFEISLRTSGSTLTDHRVRGFSGNASSIDAFDEDVLCDLDLRLRVTDKGALLRRLTLLGFIDRDPRANTRPSCERANDEHDPAVFAARLNQVAVDWSRPNPSVDGQVFVRAPVDLVNRFVTFLPVSGWVGLRGQLHWDTAMRLPN